MVVQTLSIMRFQPLCGGEGSWSRFVSGELEPRDNSVDGRFEVFIGGSV